MNERVLFEPISWNDLTEKENKRSIDSLVFLVQKRSGKSKSRRVANSSTIHGLTRAMQPTKSTKIIRRDYSQYNVFLQLSVGKYDQINPIIITVEIHSEENN